MTLALSEDTKSEIRNLLTRGKNPARTADVELFIKEAGAALTVYKGNREAQRDLKPAGVTRQALAKVTRAAERLQSQIEDLPGGAAQHVRQAFALAGADVRPFISAMNVLLSYAS